MANRKDWNKWKPRLFVSERTLARLKPCPFCGYKTIRILPQSYGYSINCEMCPARMQIVTHYIAQVIACWNSRAQP